MLLNIIFFPVWFSLFASEVVKIITIVCCTSWTWQKKLMSSISGPLLPGILLYKRNKMEVKKHELLKLSSNVDHCTNIEQAMEVQKQDEEYSMLQGHIRSVENTMEHLPQLVIAINLLIRVSYNSSLKQYYLDLLGGDLNFIIISAFISTFSLIFGQGQCQIIAKLCFFHKLIWLLKVNYKSIILQGLWHRYFHNSKDHYCTTSFIIINLSNMF